MSPTEALARALEIVNGPKNPDVPEDFPGWEKDWADELIAELAALGYEVRPIEPPGWGTDHLQEPIEQAAEAADVGTGHDLPPTAYPDDFPSAAADPDAAAFERFLDTGHSAAVALARCTCGSLDSVHSPTCARAVGDAVAPLVAKVLAAGDELTAEHGESCDCEICLAVQPLVDAAVDLAAADAIRGEA